ncbi:hypothetical protein [Streptomyces sp. NPDC059957]
MRHFGEQYTESLLFLTETMCPQAGQRPKTYRSTPPRRASIPCSTARR